MGGMRKFMPTTYKTFLIGSIALAGLPPLAGFSTRHVTPLLSAIPLKETLSRKDGPHSGNPHVRESVLESA